MIFYLKIWLSPECPERSLSQPFLNFFNSNFQKMSFIEPYFDNLMKNRDVTYNDFLPQNLAKSRVPREVVISAIFEFVQLKFSNSVFY